MFRCVYKADMTKQLINMQKKTGPGGFPFKRHTLDCTEPISTNDFRLINSKKRMIAD